MEGTSKSGEPPEQEFSPRIFVVVDRPYCAWSYTHDTEQLGFLRRFDPYFFHYTALSHRSSLVGEDAWRAGIAIRLAYSHASETLFALLFAALQAPRVPSVWLLKYQNSDLVSLLKQLSRNARIDSQFSPDVCCWEDVARLLTYSFVSTDSAFARQYCDKLSTFLKRLCAEYLEEHNKYEYNSLKHGLRASGGGSTLTFEALSEHGEPILERSFTRSSDFGGNFQVQVPIVDKSVHLRLERWFTHWHPEALIRRVQVISSILHLTIELLRMLCGEELDGCCFPIVLDKAAFEDGWMGAGTLGHLKYSESFVEQVVKSATPAQLLQRYRAGPKFKLRNPPPA